MDGIYLILGANLGDRMGQLLLAHKLLMDQVEIIRASSLYKTKAWGIIEQPDYINQVVLVQTSLSPKELLTFVLHVEQKMGRRRITKWAPRTIDIDILYYNNEVINQPGLILPHPHISKRNFVLEPLCELAPTEIHPINSKTQQELLAVCSDQSLVEKL